MANHDKPTIGDASSPDSAHEPTVNPDMGSAAQAAAPPIDDTVAQAIPEAQAAEFSPLTENHESPADHRNLALVMEIPVTCSVELGRTKIRVGDLLELARGSVISLDRAAGEPLDLLVNGYLIAHGEVVVVNDKFGIRLLDTVDRAERLQSVS